MSRLLADFHESKHLKEVSSIEPPMSIDTQAGN
jgi:hypothetical protein